MKSFKLCVIMTLLVVYRFDGLDLVLMSWQCQKHQVSHLNVTVTDTLSHLHITALVNVYIYIYSLPQSHHLRDRT